MKKTYKKLRLVAACMGLGIAGLNAAALSGVYTINSSQSTSGTNYQNFTAFANDINTNGVSGPVTVNVTTSGQTYVEQISFNQITGASAANKITINGNGNTISFSANSSSPWTISMNGADYFTFNNLNIVGTNSSYAYACILYNWANNNMFSGCTFSVPANVTSSYCVPFAISGSGNYFQSSGSGYGNNNTVTTCTLFSGYCGYSIYGTYTYPASVTGNKISNCKIQDFYQMGLYIYYGIDGTQILNNIIECPTRTTYTTKYGMYIYATQGTLVEGNWIRNLWASSLGVTSGSAYAIMMYYNWESTYTGYHYPSNYPNTIRNNIVSDLHSTGSHYGIYAFYYDGDIYNNTVSLDDQNTASGSTYGMYIYAYNGSGVSHCTNNIVSVSRLGTNTKYCYMNASGSSGSDITCDRNDFYITSGSSNYVGYHTTQATSLSQLQSQGVMANGFSANPTYSNVSAMDYHPTNASINNQGSPMGLFFDQLGAIRNPTTPDIGALEFLTPLCSGTPTNGISGPTYSLCPGEVASFSVANLSSDAGITYQWQYSSVSNVGPWTPFAGATSVFYTSGANTTNGYYSVIIACTNPGGGTTTAVAPIYISPVVTSSVPYYEDFENIGLPNRLPNCSWVAPNLTATQKTYVSAKSGNRIGHSGTSYATFETAGPVNYYYTNGIQMEPGVTYSASVWYQTDLAGNTNWSDLSIMIGTAQVSAGLTTIASSNGPAISPVYKGMGNTFTVATSGIYYVAIRATSAGGGAPYLVFDDVRVEIPCTSSLNPVNLTVSPASPTVCSGYSLTMSASGANSYKWNTGSSNAVLVTIPQINPTQLTVVGTNTLTGCTATLNPLVIVKPSPVVSAASAPLIACAGAPVVLAASGAGTYQWNTGQNTSVITVTNSSNASYTVIGTNSLNCSSSAVVAVNVNPNPNITVQAPSTVCYGEVTTMVAAGANTYEWNSSSVNIKANPVTVSPMIGTVTYTVIGTDNNGCHGTQIVNLVVDACTGVKQVAGSGITRVFPNPTNGDLNIEVAANSTGKVQLTDVTGRVLMTSNIVNDKTSLNITEFAAGVYYVKVVSGSSVETFKVIKN